MEKWLEVSGYPNYEVSSLGRVRNKKRDKFLSQHKNNSGYWSVRLFNKGKFKFFLVHRLVALAFIENPLGLPEVDHIDTNIDNNCLENLRWVTPAENRKSAKGKTFKKRTTPIAQYDLDGNLIAVYDNQMDASRKTGIGIQMINRVVNGRKRNSTHGYVFKRVVESNK